MELGINKCLIYVEDMEIILFYGNESVLKIVLCFEAFWPLSMCSCARVDEFS